MFRKAAVVLGLASLVVTPFVTHAQDASEAAEAPPPERLSVVGATMLPEGERAVVVGAGWPGLQVGGVFTPSPRFELGPRGQLLAGSPIMGLPFALGFELSVPMRVRLLTVDRLDLALSLRPYGLVGRASLVGLEGPGERDLGFAAGAQGGLRVGYRLQEKVALGVGALGSLDFVGVPDADRSDLVGTVTGMIGIESLFTRATAFFFMAEAGYGFAPADYFDTHLVLRATIGFAHTQYR